MFGGKEEMPREEFAGQYPESELVEDLLAKGEEYDYLRFQMAQNAITDQRWAANAAQVWANVMLGKVASEFPNAVVENVEHVSKTVNDDSALTTSRETLESMTDKFSKVADSVDKLASQMTSLQSSLLAALSEIEQ